MRSASHLTLSVLLAGLALVAATAGDAAAKPRTAAAGVTVRTVHRLPNVWPADALAVLRRVATMPEAVTVDEARRVLEISDTAERTPRLLRLIRAMERARPGDGVWIQPIRGPILPSYYAERLGEVLDPGPHAPGHVAKMVGDDEAGLLVIVADAPTYLRILELVKRAPSSDGAQGTVHVFPLQHADAKDVLQRLQEGAAGAASHPRLVADAATGSIVATVSLPHELDALRKAIGDLDVPARKVLLEVAVVEARVPPAPTRSPVRYDPVAAALRGLRLPGAGMVDDEARRAIWASRDPRILDRRVIFTKEAATSELRIAVRAAGPAPARDAVEGYRIALRAQGRAPFDDVRLHLDVAACTTPGAPCAGPRATTAVVFHAASTVVIPTLDRTRELPGPTPGTERAHLFVVITPHWIRDEATDVRRLVVERQIEREEARDSEALFGDASVLAPLRLHRGSRGILGEMRRAQREVEADAPLDDGPRR